MAAAACLGLFVSLFLPWYQSTVIATVGGRRLTADSVSLTGWSSFSFVEAAVLLVAVGVIVLLVQRAEGRAFHLPGGDGGVITAAGVWTCLLVVWRIFDKQGTQSVGAVASTSGIEWGIFVALAMAAVLAYAGSRIRLAHRPEPPLPGEESSVEPGGPPPPRRPSSPVRDRTMGWLTARPRHLAEADDTLPVGAAAAPAADADATLPVRREAGRAGEEDATLPAQRENGHGADPDATLPIEGTDTAPTLPTRR